MLPENETCIIVGAGSGLSASLARLFKTERMAVVLAARNIEKLADLSKEIGCELIQCDASNVEQVRNLSPKRMKFVASPQSSFTIHLPDLEATLQALIHTKLRLQLKPLAMVPS